MSMKNIAGQPVRGNDFFERPTLLRQFQQKIKSGSSVLISAPRRVGKTSLMFHVQDTGMEGYHFIYLITESVNSENEYFKRILNKIFDTEFLTPLQKISKKAYRVLEDRAARVREVGKSVKFDKESTRNFRQEFIDTEEMLNLAQKFDIPGGVKNKVPGKITDQTVLVHRRNFCLKIVDNRTLRCYNKIMSTIKKRRKIWARKNFQ